MPDYSWLLSPDSEAAPAAVVSDFTELVTAAQKQDTIARFLGLEPEKYFQLLDSDVEVSEILDSVGKTQAELDAFIASLPELQRFQADVEFSTGRQMAKVRNALDKAIRKWAIDAAEHHLYHYHSREFGSAEEMFQAALEDIPETSSTWSDLNAIATVIYPFAMTYNLSGADQLWGDGMVEKTRAAVPLLREIAQADKPTTEQLAHAQVVIYDAIHLTGTKFKEKHKSAGPQSPIQAIDFAAGQGGTLVLEYQSQLERLTIERRLQGSLEWHLGTGGEAVLKALALISKKWDQRRATADASLPSPEIISAAE